MNVSDVLTTVLEAMLTYLAPLFLLYGAFFFADRMIILIKNSFDDNEARVYDR